MNPRAKAWMKQNKEINVKGRTTTTTPLCWLDITQNVMPKSFSARPLAYLAAPLGPLASSGRSPRLPSRSARPPSLVNLT